jgi:hypothetical protein
MASKKLGVGFATVLVAASLGGCTSQGFVPRQDDPPPERRRMPTLRWNPFPTSGYESLQDRIADVSYELRIWKAVRRDFARESLVYSRRGLTDPSHQVESYLEPETLHVWAVRARFKLDGEWRLTPWSTATGWDRQAKFPDPGYASFSTGPR